MIEIREAKPEDFDRVVAFYRFNDYAAPIDPANIVIVAVEEGQIRGAIRLVAEDGVLVLRGMRVAEPFQRKGIGTRMLEQADRLLGTTDCFCIPYTHLRDFYSLIGFEEIDPLLAPRFLSGRYAKYREQMGLDVIIMRRVGQNNGLNLYRSTG